MYADTIGDVLDELDQIITRESERNSRNAYFAVLYREVTARVRDGIQDGRFDDGERMERFDVIFANRYFDAIYQYRTGDAPSKCWRKAFEVAEWWSPLIIQHVLLGVNAHINFDLGIAAARTCSAQELPDFKSDYDEINEILEETIDDIQRRISRVSPWMGLLDYVGGRTDEVIAGFCLKTARRVAWHGAKKLTSRKQSEWDSVVKKTDNTAATVTGAVLKPTFFGQPAMLAIRLRESNKVTEVVRALRR